MTEHPSGAQQPLHADTAAQKLASKPETQGRAGCTGCNSNLVTSWIVDGTPEAVREALADMMDSIQSCGTKVDMIHATEMVVAEALNNIVEHAYAGRTDGSIKIEIDCGPDDLVITVSDEGVAMPNEALPAGAAQDVDGPLESLPEGGFGWFMIHTLTENLHYERDGDHNRLSFTINPDASLI